jgi:hypothetical protein
MIKDVSLNDPGSPFSGLVWGPFLRLSPVSRKLWRRLKGNSEHPFVAAREPRSDATGWAVGLNLEVLGRWLADISDEKLA